MSQNIFGSEGSPAVPGGSVAKPLMIALLALLASLFKEKFPDHLEAVAGDDKLALNQVGLAIQRVLKLSKPQTDHGLRTSRIASGARIKR